MAEIKKLDEKVVADNGFVRCVQVFYKVDGKPRNYLLLELPGGGRSVLMIARRRSDGAIAFVSNPRASKEMKPRDVLPGGLRNHVGGETLEAAARRELFEEIGMVAKKIIPIGMTEVHPLVRDTAVVYLVDNCEPPGEDDDMPSLDPETLNVSWWNDVDIDDRFLSGELQDGQTGYALRLLKAWDRRYGSRSGSLGASEPPSVYRF